MNFRHYCPSPWLLAGALIFTLSACRAEVGISTGTTVSTASLTGATTGAVLPEEPFVNPMGTKKPKIVSGFGKRNAAVPGLIPGTTAQIVSEIHEGADYRAIAGTPVHAARSGKVIFAGFSKMYVSRTDKTDQARLVIIRHADGKSSRYVHLNALRVKPGQDVQSGQILGGLAESDEWTESVLHFEIRDIRGQALDPVKVMAEAAPAAAPETKVP